MEILKEEKKVFQQNYQFDRETYLQFAAGKDDAKFVESKAIPNVFKELLLKD